jgi:hypothetical protein
LALSGAWEFHLMYQKTRVLSPKACQDRSTHRNLGPKINKPLLSLVLALQKTSRLAALDCSSYNTIAIVIATKNGPECWIGRSEVGKGCEFLEIDQHSTDDLLMIMDSWQVKDVEFAWICPR